MKLLRLQHKRCERCKSAEDRYVVDMGRLGVVGVFSVAVAAVHTAERSHVVGSAAAAAVMRCRRVVRTVAGVTHALYHTTLSVIIHTTNGPF